MVVGIRTSVFRGAWWLVSGHLCLGAHEVCIRTSVLRVHGACIRTSVYRGAWGLVSGPSCMGVGIRTPLHRGAWVLVSEYLCLGVHGLYQDLCA